MKKTKAKTSSKKTTSVSKVSASKTTSSKKVGSKVTPKSGGAVKKVKSPLKTQASSSIIKNVKKDSFKPLAKSPEATNIKKAVEAKAEKTANKKVSTADKEKTSKIENKASSSVKVLAQGNARVIEPLSWDAEKPKLNMMLTQKVSRKDKDKEETEVKSYSIKSRYTVGDRVMHTDFGKGLVRDLIGDFKIRVAFRDFEKVLVHGIN